METYVRYEPSDETPAPANTRRKSREVRRGVRSRPRVCRTGRMLRRPRCAVHTFFWGLLPAGYWDVTFGHAEHDDEHATAGVAAADPRQHGARVVRSDHLD